MATTTLLEASNEVLRAVGKRPLINFTGVTADKLRDVFKQAVRDIEGYHQWDWLNADIPATSWVADKATLPDIQRIRNVYIGDTTDGYRSLIWVNPRQYNFQGLTSYTGEADYARYYTNRGYSTVCVNPYPADAISQSRIQFAVVLTLSVPVDATSTFTIIPERYIQLLVKRACYLFAFRHLADVTAAQVFQSEVESMVRQYRANEPGIPHNVINMYGGNRLWR